MKKIIVLMLLLSPSAFADPTGNIRLGDITVTVRVACRCIPSPLHAGMTSLVRDLTDVLGGKVYQSVLSEHLNPGRCQLQMDSTGDCFAL